MALGDAPAVGVTGEHQRRAAAASGGAVSDLAKYVAGTDVPPGLFPAQLSGQAELLARKITPEALSFN